MLTTLHKRQDCNHGSPGCPNVVLYHSDIPVISVEQGTTFGLAKMLYGSVGGHGQIIGLKQRQHSSALACIITQDQTILIEREYDIILHALHGTSKERRLDTISPICHHKDGNTYISPKPDAQLWRAKPYSTPRQTILEKDVGNIANLVKFTRNDGRSWSERRDTQRNSNESLAASIIDTEKRQKIVPLTSCSDYVTSRKEMRINCADEGSDEIRVISPADSTSPSSASIESPASNQNSPNQIEHSCSRKRKWQCFYCKKFFVCRSAYNNHERIHTGEKPFQCDVCGRCFGHQGNLKQHMHIHRDVKPHVCDVCGRGFIRSNRLRDHKRSHQYDLFMHAQVQWYTANVTTESRAKVSPVTTNAFEKYASSDDNQESL